MKMISTLQSVRSILGAAVSMQLLWGLAPAALCSPITPIMVRPHSPISSAATLPIAPAKTSNIFSLQGKSSLSVGKGSSYIIDINSSTPIKLSGNLNNAGIIYVISTNPNLLTATISAANILNLRGALFTTVIPAGGLPGFSSLTPHLSLDLIAINRMANYGTISSSGSVYLSAGNSITNQVPRGVLGTIPTITATQHVTLQAPSIINAGLISSKLNSVDFYTANLTNSGVLQALSGQINIQNPLSNSLIVNNTNGTLMAGTGINFATLGSSTDLNSNALLQVNGGILQAPQVSFTSPGGKISVDVDQITGGVNLTGGTALVDVTNGGLTMANVSLSGDPIFASHGTLNLDGLFTSGAQFATYGGDFIALSGGDIIAPLAPAGANINAEAQSGAGGRIFIDAGTNFTVIHPDCKTCSLGTDYTIPINSTSATGGSIIMPGVELVTNNNSITLLATATPMNESFPSVVKLNAGSISIGNIILCCSQSTHPTVNPTDPPVTITASGDVNLNSIINTTGTITVQSQLGNVIVAPNQQLQSFGGNLSLTANQSLSTGANVTIDAVGGNIYLTAQNGQLTTGSNNNISAFQTGSTGGQLNLLSHGDVQIGSSNNLYSDTGIGVTSTNGNISTGSNTTFQSCEGNVTITSQQGSITLADANTINAAGGNTTLTACGNIQTGNNDTLNAFNQGGSGGNVTLCSNNGNIAMGESNMLNAVGGDLTVRAGGNITVSDSSQYNAFNQNSSGGNVAFTSQNGNVGFGNNDMVNAVGGNLTITAPGSFSSGTMDNFNAFVAGTGPSSTGGQLTITTGNVSIGDNNQLVGQSGVDVTSTCGDIDTGKCVLMHTCDGDVKLRANGNICLGDENTIEANGGNIELRSAKHGKGSIFTGTNDLFNAWNESGQGGNIKFSAPKGSIYIGMGNTFNAVGGNVKLRAHDDIAVNDNTTINAFRQTGSGGGVSLDAKKGDIQLGNFVSLNAIGGNINLTANGGSISTGSNDSLSAYRDGGCCTGAGGKVNLLSNGDITLGASNNIVAGDSINVTSRHGNIDTDKNSTFLACCGNIDFNAKHGSIMIGISNTMTAISGDIILKSASGGSTGNITTSQSDVFDAFNGSTGGGNVLFLAKDGKITVGNGNTINAAGGNVFLLSSGNLKVGNESLINAFNVNGIGGNVTFDSQHANILIGPNNQVNAVGGDITITAENGRIRTGKSNTFSAFSTAGGQGGDLSLLALGNIKIGADNTFIAGSDINIDSSAGKISTGQGSTFHTCNGDINVNACDGSISIGDTNTMSAGGGNVNLAAHKNIVTGTGDTFNAFVNNGYGGNVDFTSSKGQIGIGASNQLNAVGGDICLDSHGNLSTGSGTTLSAFQSGNTGGNVNLLSHTGDIKIGPQNILSAVGGDVTLSAKHGSITAGPNDTFQAFSGLNNSGGNVDMASLCNINLLPGDHFDAVGGNINLDSCNGSIIACDVKFCTFEPVSECKGNINISAFHDLILDHSQAGAANNVNLNSNCNVVLTADSVAAGNKDSGGSISISGGNNGNIILSHDNQLFAHGNVSLQAGENINLGSSCDGNNTIGSQRGDISLAAENINLGVHDSIQAERGGITLASNNGNITLGSHDLLAAGGGNLDLTARHGDVDLGSHNTLNAFYNLACPSEGGSVKVTAKEGSIDLGEHNQINAVGGKIDLTAICIDQGKDNSLCVFPKDDRNNCNNDSCIPPERPIICEPVICCTLPTAPTPPIEPPCPIPQVTIPVAPPCPTTTLTPPPPPVCPTPPVTPPTPPVCQTPPTPPPCPPAPIPPIPPTPPSPPSPSSSSNSGIIAGGIQTAPPPLTRISRLAGEIPLQPITLVGNQCDAFYILQSPLSYLQSTAGTRVAISGPNAVKISNNGQSAVKAGPDTPLTVQSGDTNITLQPNAIAVIDSKSGDMLTVTALGDEVPDGVNVSVDNQSYHIKPGEQLLIGKVSKTSLSGNSQESSLDMSGARTNLSSNDGRTNLSSGASESPAPVYVMKAAVNLPEYISTFGLMHQCRSCRLRNYLYNKTNQPEVATAKQGEEASLPSDQTKNTAHHDAKDQIHDKAILSPVAYSESQAILPNNIFSSGSAELTTKGTDHYELRRGNALIQTNSTSTAIDTEIVSVLAKKGAVLLLTDSRELTRVRNLCDHNDGDVQIQIGATQVKLGPGKEIAVSRLRSDLIPRVFADGMARRNVKSFDLPGGYNVVTDEFSIMNAMALHPLLLQLRLSHLSSSTKMLNEVNKMTAVLSLTSDRYKGPYFGGEVRPGTGIAQKMAPIY